MAASRFDNDSPLIGFYRGDAADSAGRTLAEIWAWDDRRLEAVHDYIQWLFPLPDASRFNPDAPLLTAQDAAVIRASAELQQRFYRSFDRMLGFLGFVRDGGAIVRGPQFAARSTAWLTPANHNYLRLTRIILCLGYVGLGGAAAALLACLENVAVHEGKAVIGARTLGFWRDASVHPPPLS